MKKFPHKLRENKSNKFAKYFFFFDTETQFEKIDNQEHHTLKVGFVKDAASDSGIFFDNVKYFWDYITQGTEVGTTYVYAHNMHFDFNIVQGFIKLYEYGYEITLAVLESGTFIVAATNRKSRKRLIFLDTFNYFKMSVERMGEMLGLPKGKINFETCSLEELKTYCKRDVEIIELIMRRWKQFLHKHKLGVSQYTIASQAFTAFRHKYMDSNIYIHNHPEAIRLEQKSYRGGRTEAFHIGALENILVVDVNSLYPFIMQFNQFPSKLLGYTDNLSIRTLLHLLNQDLLVIADCEVQTSLNSIGLRHKINNTEKLIFPVGSFRATLTNPELFLLLRTGAKIKEVYELSWYKPEYIFKKYVKELYELRLKYQKENDYTFQSMVKDLLNSLYGKFGQRERELEVLGETSIDDVFREQIYDLTTGERYTIYSFGGKIWRQRITQEESINSFTAVASYVTAYARTYLYLLMQIPNTVYYCDTDSLMIPKEELTLFGHFLGENIGQLKIDYGGEKCYIFGAKDYWIDDVVKRKGIKRNAIEVSENTFQQLQFHKTKSLIKEGFVDRVIIELVEKKCERIYDKGIVLPNGKVEPLSL